MNVYALKFSGVPTCHNHAFKSTTDLLTSGNWYWPQDIVVYLGWLRHSRDTSLVTNCNSDLDSKSLTVAPVSYEKKICEEVSSLRAGKVLEVEIPPGKPERFRHS